MGGWFNRLCGRRSIGLDATVDRDKAKQRSTGGFGVSAMRTWRLGWAGTLVRVRAQKDGEHIDQSITKSGNKHDTSIDRSLFAFAEVHHRGLAYRVSGRAVGSWFSVSLFGHWFLGPYISVSMIFAVMPSAISPPVNLHLLWPRSLLLLLIIPPKRVWGLLASPASL